MGEEGLVAGADGISVPYPRITDSNDSGLCVVAIYLRPILALRAIIQRVTQASVSVNGVSVASIDTGLLALVGFGNGDSEEKIGTLLDKICLMRIFPNEQGRFDKSLEDITGQLLLVPQFTLFADTSKGRRPEFFSALTPDKSSPLFSELVLRAKQRLCNRIECGIFGADMKVALVNDGPVTISVEI